MKRRQFVTTSGLLGLGAMAPSGSGARPADGRAFDWPGARVSFAFGYGYIKALLQAV
jgi:hypothetical protein